MRVIISYLAVWALLFSPLYEAMALHPDTGSNDLYAIKQILDSPRQEYFVDSHGSKLHAWLFKKPGSHTLVIVHHGNAGNIICRLFLARAFIRAGTSVIIYDYRGYGKSAGTAHLGYLAEDGIAMFDFAKTQLNYPTIINYGESIGSAVACAVDHQRKPDGLILQSGIASLPQVAKSLFPLLLPYPDFIWPQPRFDNCALLALSKTPLLVLHGQRDRLVPCVQSQWLFDSSAACQKAFIKLAHCGHNDVGYYDPELFQNSLNNFVNQQVSNAGKRSVQRDHQAPSTGLAEHV